MKRDEALRMFRVMVRIGRTGLLAVYVMPRRADARNGTDGQGADGAISMAMAPLADGHEATM
jgi:hypothetical protein